MTIELLSLAADVAVRVTLLAAAIAVVLALFRIGSSSTRHAAWTMVTCVMLLMPVMVRMVPPVKIPVPAEMAFQWEMEAQRPALRDSQPPLALPAVAVMPEASAPVANPPTPNAAAAARTPPTPVGLGGVLISVYAVGVLGFVAHLLVGLVQLSRIRRNSRPASDAGPDIFESSVLATPVTIGLLSPRVVLPAGWREWPVDMLAAVIAHERAHVSRRDPLIAALARVNCALYWFHPLAWWLRRELAVTAEHACDDAAVRAVPRRQYAETLLEMAAIVRRHRGRLVISPVGVDGGQLGRRIDRVLAAASAPALSRTRGALAAVSCVVVIAAAVACRQEVRAEPLREDPQVAAELKAQDAVRRERTALYTAAERMTRDEAAAVERDLDKNPEDRVTREQLLIFYGRNKAAEDWKVNAAARRPHALWLVQHHPDGELVTSARVSKREDPEGYAQVRELWLKAIAKDGRNTKVLSNAAAFFSAAEKPLAEELLLRARELKPNLPLPPPGLDPRADWSWRLGTLYAYAIIGRADDDPDLQWARQRLEQSNDARVLFAAGQDLSWRPAQAEWKQFGRRLLEAASQLDAGVAQRVRTLLYQRDVLTAQGAFGGRPRQEWPALLERSKGLEKLRQLAALSEQEYMIAEYYDWLSRQTESIRRSAVNRGPVSPDQDRQRAGDMFVRSKRYAREAIDVASSVTDAEAAEATFRAQLAYGLNTLREGDRKAAIDHLLAASKLPSPSAPLAFGWASPLEYRLVYYLLKNGERPRIVEYLERAAQGRDENARKVMLEAAAAIRDGRMPEHYQMLLTSGHI